ncbi:uncharacterized protein LOC130803698 [Amaranthus tricolor]|uniref:uncharacterized protein LOC130803698 n=1 Tax=Amaranthus tricolor TaxID=29722 RepID=UPI0025857F9E|nr:uncharacterized protein LOC130803698 [Amaranthus tricolor]
MLVIGRLLLLIIDCWLLIVDGYGRCSILHRITLHVYVILLTLLSLDCPKATFGLKRYPVFMNCHRLNMHVPMVTIRSIPLELKLNLSMFPLDYPNNLFVSHLGTIYSKQPLWYQNPPFNPPFSQNTPNSFYYIPENIPNSSYYVPQNTGESLDENEMEYDDDEDDDDENEGNDQDDQYGEDEGNSVHHVDASLYTQPSFQDLVSQFGSPPSFTQLVQPSQQLPNNNDEAPIPSKKSWDLIEDIALICSVMNTSTDPIVSTNQKIRVRWQKVKEAYEAARMERPHLIPRRTADMLKCRWKMEASGKTNQKKQLDQQPTGDVSSKSSGKRSRTEEDSETPTSEPQGGPSSRPEGVKKAKARMTGKMVADQSIQALSAFGEKQKKKCRIQRDHSKGHSQLFNDYFVENPTYSSRLFRRRFRMRKHVFLRIMEAVSNNDPWFTTNIDATCRKGLSALQKCTAALRMLAYGVAANQVDEYLQISESTAREALTHITKGIINQFGQHYLRKPTPQDLTRLLAFSEERGFPGMIGSVDCMHWEWKNCPAAWKGQYQGRAGVATLILEAVANHDLWIWHAFFWMPGSYNDLNVLYRSPLLVNLFEGRAPPVNFTVNGNQYGMAYYLTDGIYPKWATFIQSITEPQTAKTRLFAQHQEAARKDVERAFGVLKARFAIIRKPSLAWDEERLSDIITSCIIMHNMIVEDERDTYTHYADGREFMRDRPKGQSEGTSGLNDDFEYYTDRIVDINRYLTNKDDVEDRQTHLSLKDDLVENI